MADDQLAELLKTQKSLTEWLEDIKHTDVARIRQEDNDKRERLRVLNEIIGLPYDKPTQFEAAEIRDDNPKFTKFLAERGNELCALRLMPKVPDLPKLRMRGKSIKDVYGWFKDQKIKPELYRADFVPHPPDYKWSTIFIVNQHGIQGEIIWGGHHQLTQGFHYANAPIAFRYDFKDWALLPANQEAEAHLRTLAEYLHVPEAAKRQGLKDTLGAAFAHDYLEGYFESADSSMGTWFIDYSQALGDLYADAVISTEEPVETGGVTGKTASPGQAEGPVCVVPPDDLDVEFPDGGVLVCEVTTPNYVPLMQKAAAIVTDQGGILSHAAIVARELHIPCIVGTGNATDLLKNGQIVSVDADKGTVTLA